MGGCEIIWQKEERSHCQQHKLKFWPFSGSLVIEGLSREGEGELAPVLKPPKTSPPTEIAHPSLLLAFSSFSPSLRSENKVGNSWTPEFVQQCPLLLQSSTWHARSHTRGKGEKLISAEFAPTSCCATLSLFKSSLRSWLEASALSSVSSSWPCRCRSWWTGDLKNTISTLSDWLRQLFLILKLSKGLPPPAPHPLDPIPFFSFSLNFPFSLL